MIMENDQCKTVSENEENGGKSSCKEGKKFTKIKLQNKIITF